MKERLLVVDDDPKITSMLRRNLTLEGYEVSIATSGEEALRQIRDEVPDLVVLDVMMPGVDGIEVCRRLRSAGESVPILMLTARDEVSDRVLGLDAGADDYLVKPFAFDELSARIRALLRRRQGGSERVLRFADLTVDLAAREVTRGGRAIQLTATEFELLTYFMRHPRQVLSRESILENVWGYDFGGSSNVLEVYVGYLRQKLEQEGEPRLIHTVRGAGYVLRD
ncbi:MAG: response regulator transcription factor [Firmicutes bacterium]|nr:response regulator transcription factor [Bacillota bacterium]